MSQDPLLKTYTSGFPFEEFRPGQQEVLYSVVRGIVEDGKVIHIIEAPTGSGKSPIAIGIARTLNHMFETICLSPLFYGNDTAAIPNPATKSIHTYKSMQFRLSVSKMTTKYEAKTGMAAESDAVHHKVVLAAPKKALQDQYIRDFADKDSDVGVLKGRSNYACGYDPGVPANQCGVYDPLNALDRERPSSCWACESCAFSKAVKDALNLDPITITNFHSMRSWLLYADNFLSGSAGNRYPASTLIIDEAHLLPEFLLSYMSEKVNLKKLWSDLKTALEYSGPPDDDGFVDMDAVEEKTDGRLEHWSRFFEDARQVLETMRETPDYKLTANDVTVLNTRLLTAFNTIEAYFTEDADNDFAEEAAYYNKLRRVFLEAAQDLLDYARGDKTAEESSFYLHASEDNPDEYGVYCRRPVEGFRQLRKEFQHIILLSATISPEPFRDQLGIDPEICAIHKVNPQIPVDYRPLVFVGDKQKTNMRRANRDDSLPEIAARIVKLSRLHPKWRGVIHTRSGANARALFHHMQQLLRGEPTGRNPDRIGRFIFHFGGPKERHMEAFLRDVNDNSVIISPSLAEGFDGKGKVARWQCIIKIPYLPPNDGAVKARMQEADGEMWYILQTATALSQMYGRVNRGPTDYGITYILDGGWSGFNYLMKKRGAWEHAPVAFIEGVRASSKFWFHYREDGTLHPALLLDTHPSCQKSKKLVKPIKVLELL